MRRCPRLFITVPARRLVTDWTLNREPLIGVSDMARSTRSSELETRSARLDKLPVDKKPVFVRIGPKLGLGYRRNQTGGAWVLRVADGRGGYKMTALGLADDYEVADGNRVLDYWQAQEKARALGRGDRGSDWAKPATVNEALDAYETDLKTRSGDIGNVTRLRAHLPPGGLRDKPVALLVAADLRRWRDGLVRAPVKKKHSGKTAPKKRRAQSARLAAATEEKKPGAAKPEPLSSSTINRTCTVLKAALNFAAEHDERIANRRAWETGLATIPDAERSRNVILEEAAIRSIIAAAHAVSPEFGLLVEVAAVTGARASQLARLEAQDLQADRANPRLQMPASRKGKGVKKITRYPVPIPAGLAAGLHAVTKDRAAAAPLLVKPSGERWRKSDHARPFRRAAKAAKQDPTVITMYALRHSNIVRQILAGVPIRIVAVNHDTSVTMIERNYSRYIGDHSDLLARVALLDTTAPTAGANVVQMRAGKATE